MDPLHLNFGRGKRVKKNSVNNSKVPTTNPATFWTREAGTLVSARDDGTERGLGSLEMGWAWPRRGVRGSTGSRYAPGPVVLGTKPS